nr:hypothetical protein CKG001_10350 [Bdellovibrio sp. CKG001]
MASEKKYEKTLTRVGTNIKRLRKARGLSQQDMVDMGYNLRHIQRIESGSHSVNLYTLQKIADDLRSDISELFKPIKRS